MQRLRFLNWRQGISNTAKYAKNAKEAKNAQDAKIATN